MKCVPRRSAERAWFKTALGVEQSQVTGTELTPCVIDLSKAFDDVSRDHLYSALRRASFPQGVRRAYAAMLETVPVRNHIMDHIERPVKRSRTIPQGDPMSMLMQAVLVPPWIKCLRGMGGTTASTGI